MAFLTIFTAPKPFTNPHINIIQRNALAAWTQLANVDVILIGDEPGIPEYAKEFGIQNVPQVERDERGIPLVSAVMEIGHAHSDSPLLCFANTDMILMSDVVEAARTVSEQVKDFLLVGQRWNLDLPEPFDFSGDWESRLRLDVAQRGEFYSPWGIDYFVFPRNLYKEVPNFTIGRPAWDNWMVCHARTSFGMAIDASRDVVVVHQNHDYSHLPGNRPPYGSEVAKSNLAKAGGRKHVYNILDTNRELVRGRIHRPQIRFVRLLRQMERMLINNEGRGWGWELSLKLQQMQRPLAIKPRR
ncbi:MAG: hypothetical protein D4R46_00020 [Chloroflexi bacterium]|nr:MAG: hypothetical protein D4R46_00020 [Chloroflexota bacterium]